MFDSSNLEMKWGKKRAMFNCTADRVLLFHFSQWEKSSLWFIIIKQIKISSNLIYVGVKKKKSLKKKCNTCKKKNKYRWVHISSPSFILLLVISFANFIITFWIYVLTEASMINIDCRCSIYHLRDICVLSSFQLLHPQCLKTRRILVMPMRT